MDCAFGVVSKKLLPNARSFRFSLLLSSRSFIVLFYKCFISLAFYKSVVHFELNFVKDVKSMYHCFACGYLVSPLSFDRKTILSPLNLLCSLFDSCCCC